MLNRGGGGGGVGVVIEYSQTSWCGEPFNLITWLEVPPNYVFSFIRPILEYADVVWDNIWKKQNMFQ